MAKASDNEFPKVLLVPGSAPVVPAGLVGVFIDSADGHLKRVDAAAEVTDTEAGGSGAGGDSAWTAPTLINSWILSTGTDLPPAGYRKDASGFVHLRGIIKGGASGTVAFTLPAGYRPAYDTTLNTVIGNSGGSSNIPDLIIVKASGSVQVNTTGPWVWMPSGSFLAEA